MVRLSPRSLVLLLALAIAALGPLAAARAQDGTPAVDESLSGTVTFWATYNTVSPSMRR